MLQNVSRHIRFLVICIISLHTVNMWAQMSHADVLFDEGSRLRQTFTISSQEAAIDKFKRAKIAYTSPDKKEACEKQIALCNKNIERIKGANQKPVSKPKPDVTVEVVQYGETAKAVIDTENIEIWPDRNVKVSDQDEDGVRSLLVQIQLEIDGMKDKPCDVMISFSDEYGRPLKDKNNKPVILEEKITPEYQGASWKNFKMAIPYRDLYLSGSGQKTLKLTIAVFDISGSKAKQMLVLPPIETSFFYDDTFITVDGEHKAITKEFASEGGRVTFKVNTNADKYELVDVPEWCRIENQTATGFTLVCTPNEGTRPRPDYFKVQASKRESVTINVFQKEANGPSATIHKVWVDHNRMNFTTKGMWVHIDTKVNGMMDQDVYYVVQFYQSDNKTPLIDRDGQQITQQSRMTSDYDEIRWADWYLFIPYYRINNPSNGEGPSYTLDCIIKDSKGNELARSRNHSFSLP